MSLKDRIQDDMKSAMRAKDKERLATIRLILAAVKQREVDERIALDDEQVIEVLDRMAKQRRESIAQYSDAGRDDLAARESFELDIIKTYMPETISDADLNALIEQSINAQNAVTMRDMGKVMALIKPQVQGKADMGAVSQMLKKRLH